LCGARFGLGTRELGGDALQNRVEVLCLDQFVGLQMLEGPVLAATIRFAEVDGSGRQIRVT
jgi:hypothetical protein